MRLARFVLSGLLLVGAATSMGAHATLDVPVHVRRLSDKAIVVLLGDFAWANQTIALVPSRNPQAAIDCALPC
jgi:hypothetical protein